MSWSPLRALVCGTLLCLWQVAASALPPIGEVTPVRALTQTDEGALLLPADVEVDGNGRTWVVDSGRHRIVAFDPFGQFLFAVGGRGKAPGKLSDPLGIGLDGRGNLYVADAGNQRIQVFDSGGKFIRELPLVYEGLPARPADVAVDEGSGDLFVSLNDRHQILRLSPEGTLEQAWGKEGTSQGEFRYPAMLVVREGLVYVVDVLNTRVQIFGTDGVFSYQIGEWGVLPGQLFRPKGIAIDSRGWVYVSDSYMDMVQVFDAGFEFRHVLGRGGRVQKFTAPTGMAIDARDTLYVTEMLGNKVSVFDLH